MWYVLCFEENMWVFVWFFKMKLLRLVLLLKFYYILMLGGNYLKFSNVIVKVILIGIMIEW